MTNRKLKIPKDIDTPLPTDDFIDIDFYVPAKDERGHADTFTFKLDPRYSAQISKMVQHPALPYESNSDLIRHAIKNHLEWLDRVVENPPVSSYSIIRATEFMQAELHIQGNLSKMLESSSETMKMLADDGKWDVVLDNIVRIRGLLKAFPDNSNRRQVEKKLGPMLEHYEGEALKYLGDVPKLEETVKAIEEEEKVDAEKPELVIWVQ